MDNLTFAEQIRIIMRRRGLSVEQLAGLLDTSKQNLNQQLKRDNFREKDMTRIADVLGCKVSIIVDDLEK